MRINQNLPNRKRNRIRNYDYSENGYYFVTICTHGKIFYFGQVENGRMLLNEYGKIVKKYWEAIPEHYNFVKLDQYVIMPNHIHGIIAVNRPHNFIKIVGIGHGSIKSVGTEQCSVRTSKINKDTRYGLISKIEKSFKEMVVKEIHRRFVDYSFLWQRSFYDHVVRVEESLEKIREYIFNNSLKWHLDINNPNRRLDKYYFYY